MNNVYSGSERRKSKRIRACFTVIYKLSKQIEIKMWIGGKEVSAIMIDLSQDGMAILSENDIPKSTTLSIKFTLINEFKKKENQLRPIEMEGEVRYNNFLKEKAYRLGIAFTKIKEEDKFEIADFVNTTKAWDPSA